MKHEITGIPPEDDEHAVRRDFEAFVRELEATPGKRVSVVFGFAWGNEIYAGSRVWLALDLTGSELRARVDAAESSGVGQIGSDDLRITLPDLGVERLYCHEDDIHVFADDRDHPYLEAQRQTWLTRGWEVYGRDLA